VELQHRLKPGGLAVGAVQRVTPAADLNAVYNHVHADSDPFAICQAFSFLHRREESVPG